MTTSREVPEAFWSQTVFPRLDREPFVLRAAEGANVFSLERLWPLVLRAVESRRRQSKVPSVTFYVDRAEPMDVDPWLPRADHATLASYLRSLVERAGERDFTLLVNGAQVLSPELFAEVRAFLAPLADHAGVAVTETAIYLSRARRTVFGVHCDESSNFLFVTYGKKRFRLWPREVLDAHPRFRNAVEYGPIEHLSTLVELEAGDLLYMPAGCYHIAESDGFVGMHLSLVVNVDPGMARTMVAGAATRVVAERLRGVASAPFLPAHDDGGRVRLPSALAAGKEALVADLAPQLRRALHEQWAKLASADGFANVPPLAPARPVSDDDELAIIGGRPVTWCDEDGDLLVAANGHALRVSAPSSLAAALARLNGGDPHRVGALIAAHGEALRALLTSLVAMGGLAVAGRAPSPAAADDDAA